MRPPIPLLVALLAVTPAIRATDVCANTGCPESPPPAQIVLDPAGNACVTSALDAKACAQVTIPAGQIAGAREKTYYLYVGAADCIEGPQASDCRGRPSNEMSVALPTGRLGVLWEETNGAAHLQRVPEGGRRADSAALG